MQLVACCCCRFCYHHRLSIAGNCRMCLVEVRQGYAAGLVQPMQCAGSTNTALDSTSSNTASLAVN